uniref:Uncharacterized protein LOC102809776 n=1 Tax=Saccoglossus kowalevskii TaxID=10224 RepID=A0ABM0LTR3_SACKO|nr:PREDICTED: uncharacterized protein LOC102809776 [Saccoglossus kowalevskii]
MDSSSSEDSEDENVHPFDIFVEELGVKITESVFCTMKRLCRRKISTQKMELMKYPADLICALIDAAVISEKNMKYLSEILKVAGEKKLANEVEAYRPWHSSNRGNKRKRTKSDADVNYNVGRYVDIPIPIGLDEKSVEDQMLYQAAMRVFDAMMKAINSSDDQYDVLKSDVTVHLRSYV